MSPEEIKLTYFFDQPNYKFKLEPEYLQYSEADDCYSELSAEVAIESKDILQNEAHQIQQHHSIQNIIKNKNKLGGNLKSNDKLLVINHNNDTDFYEFYGLIPDGDYIVESEL